MAHSAEPFSAGIVRDVGDDDAAEGMLFLSERTDIFQFRDDFPNGPHEPRPM
jgi:hypothetical protein